MKNAGINIIPGELHLSRFETFYVFFETLNPDDNIRLIRAEKTKELADFRKGIDGIPKYLSNTFKIKETAKQRRPDKLLKPADKKNN